jgi:hypothetical protein
VTVQWLGNIYARCSLLQNMYISTLFQIVAWHAPRYKFTVFSCFNLIDLWLIFLLCF